MNELKFFQPFTRFSLCPCFVSNDFDPILLWNFIKKNCAFDSFIFVCSLFLENENNVEIAANIRTAFGTVFSDWNGKQPKIVILPKNFSSTLQTVIGDANFVNDVYEKVWGRFENDVPEQCFVFFIIDGKDVPIPIFRREDNEDYSGVLDHNDVLINNFGIERYLNSIVAIGIENDTERFYAMLKDDDNSSAINVKFQELLKQDAGLFVQTAFSMSTEKEAILRKAAMLISIDRSFRETLNQDDVIVDKAKSLCNDGVENMHELLTYGSMCLTRCYRLFLAQQSYRLNKTLIDLVPTRKRKRL
uniref:Uncharacterized protein n=1 Tax=Panagrolaimus sp. ES5 TaxID=591445 RepID=A0AC34FHM4_9BILA